MADDFPTAAGLYAAPRAGTRAKTSSRKRAKGKAKRSTAAERRALSEAAEDIAGDDSAPETQKRGKSYIDKIADKVTGDIFKKQYGKRKPSAAQRRTNAQASEDLAAKLMGIANTPVGKLAKTGGALAIGTTAALALIAGVGSYYATTYIIDRLAAAKEARTPEHIRFEAAMAYRQARIEAAQKLGRALTSEEQKYLGAQFKQKLATIGG